MSKPDEMHAVIAMYEPMVGRRDDAGAKDRHSYEIRGHRGAQDEREAKISDSSAAGVEFTNGEQPGVRLKKGKD